MSAFVIADPGMARALRAGRKTQLREVARGPLAQVRPGDRVLVREPCIAARDEQGEIFATSLARAEMVIFADGWRRYRDGREISGRAPTDPDHRWMTALHMPRWAARLALRVAWVRTAPLCAISRRELRAEGMVSVAGGLLWRWPRPRPGIDWRGRRLFAHHWDMHHDQPGDRWADDPAVLVIGFRAERCGI